MQFQRGFKCITDNQQLKKQNTDLQIFISHNSSFYITLKQYFSQELYRFVYRYKNKYYCEN